MLQKIIQLICLGLLALVLSVCQSRMVKQSQEPSTAIGQVSRAAVLSQTAIPVLTYRIVKTHPHDVTSYTEGLLMRDGYLYEGTGRYGQSKLLKTDLETGTVIQKHELGSSDFGEGITVFQDRVFQLTYKSNIGFVYDKADFSPRGTFSYPSQGWGLTNDDHELIMSDGSASLLFLDPNTLEQKRYITVSDETNEIGFLNELEYINGEVFANVWQTDLIARISPETGKVTGWIDLTGINPDPAKLKYPYVLNGIAYDEKSDHLLVTGKCWPNIFEIELVPIDKKDLRTMKQ